MRIFFFRYIIRKSKVRETVGLVLKRAGYLVAKGKENAEVLSAAFSLVFTVRLDFSSSSPLSSEGKSRDLPSVEED